MARFAKLLFLVVIATSLCLGPSAQAAQSSQPAAQTPAASSPSPAAAPAANDKPRGSMPAVLTKSLDSKKLKEGDQVTASITAEVHTRDGLTIPRDSKLTGHVTEAKARSKGDPQSALGIVFDKITLPGGKELAIKGVIQAVAANPKASAQSGSSGIGPGMMAGHEGTGAGTTPPPMPSMAPTPQAGTPVLNGQSKGVVGIHNLELGDNSVLFTSGKEVKLDSGIQMMVLVQVE